jgi:hypothetical protein
MPQHDTLLDAATRFLRSNPELLELARRGAAENHVSVEALLADTVRRVRRSGFEAVTQEGEILRTANRDQRRTPQGVGIRRPPVDDVRSRLIVLASG